MISGFIILVPLVLVVGCGPAPSVEVSRSGTTAEASDAAGTRTAAGISHVAEADCPAPPTPNPARPLVVPEALAKELASPDDQVQALDRLGRSAPVGAVDPVTIVALEDEGERIQVRALELLVQDWQRAQATKPSAGLGPEANGDGR